MIKAKKYMSDTEIWLELQEYGDIGYEDMPKWLKNELIARQLTFDTRQPTIQEMLETEQDAKEHRLFNNEMNLDDYKERYHV